MFRDDGQQGTFIYQGMRGLIVRWRGYVWRLITVVHAKSSQVW